MRVLGIDPGTRVTGYGLVGQRKQNLYYIEAGGIKISARLTLPQRLRQIYEGLGQIIRQFQPEAVAVENTFLANNFSSALKLGQACGVALLTAELSGIPVFEYTPAEVKVAVVGHGAADKEQVQRMVGVLLFTGSSCGSEVVKASHHAADALAVAICHLHSRTLREMAMSGERIG